MSKSLNIIFATSFLASMLCLAGCHTGPNWGPQGTIGAQRTKAVLHDPFPDNDIGPAVVGGRPLGYERPKSESSALQSSPFARKGLRGDQSTPNYQF